MEKSKLNKNDSYVVMPEMVLIKLPPVEPNEMPTHGIVELVGEGIDDIFVGDKILVPDGGRCQHVFDTRMVYDNMKPDDEDRELRVVTHHKNIVVKFKKAG